MNPVLRIIQSGIDYPAEELEEEMKQEKIVGVFVNFA
jgi:hypothetical protein